MIKHTEIFVLLWLLPVFTQIVIPLVMLLFYSLVKIVQEILSLFEKGATQR